MDLAAGAAAVAAVQGLRWRRGGGGGEESDGSSGGVELSLRLRTGDGGSSSAPPATATVVAEEEREAAAAAEEVEARRRNMTIFYKGRVCAVDVTEVQVITLTTERAAHHPTSLITTQSMMILFFLSVCFDHQFVCVFPADRHEQIRTAALSLFIPLYNLEICASRITRAWHDFFLFFCEYTYLYLL